MLFSTAAAPAASFSCLLSFAVESTGPRFHQPALTCAGALAAVPAMPGHVSTLSHPQPLQWPGRGIAHSLSLHVGTSIGSGKRALQSYLKRWLDKHFARVSREGLCKRHYASNQLALVQKLIFKYLQSLKLKPLPQKSKTTSKDIS